MSTDFGSDKKSALKAKFDASKIAFAPIMFQAAKALRDLGILEYLLRNRRKGADIETIAESLKLSVYGVKVLLEAGLSLELVILSNERFFLTKTGYFILKDPMTRVNMDFTHDVNYLAMFHLQDSIKNGKPEGLKVFGDWATLYEALSQLPKVVRDSWLNFDHYFSDNAFPKILPLLFNDKPAKILDIGGNTGKFSIYCAKQNPDVFMTILDLPGQVKDALINIKAAGLENRISTHALDLLDDSIPFPTGYDAIWMSQFLDCFSQNEILSLLKRSYAALSNDAALYILELYWDKQQYKASTYGLHATSLYFTAMANGNSQMYHSEDMEKLIDQSGLYIEKAYENIGDGHTLFKCKRVLKN